MNPKKYAKQNANGMKMAKGNREKSNANHIDAHNIRIYFFFLQCKSLVIRQ